MYITELGEQDRTQWDEYVFGPAESGPFHISAWKDVLEETFGNETHYFMATDGGKVVGVLPLLRLKSPLVGHYVTSLPGGMCASSDEAADALLLAAKDLVRASKARYLILRDGRKKWELPELVTDEEHVSFRIEVSGGQEQVRQSLKKRTRQLIDQSLRGQLELLSGLEALEVFYPLFSRAMRQLGTPTPGLAFFKSAARHVPANLSLLTVCHEEQVAGGGVISPFGDTVCCIWSGMLREFYSLRTSHFLVWETIRYAIENGYYYVDLGRCRIGSGGYVFKRSFGGQVEPLYQQTYLSSARQPPAVGHSLHKHPRFRIFAALWKNLPMPVTEVLGPWLRKGMPFG